MEKLEEIIKEANLCLGCKLKPCSKACPMNTDIPEFISKVKDQKIEEAYNILIQNNLFSHICSKICPQEQQCQGSCVRAIKFEPTKIGRIENFVNDWAVENSIEPKIEIKECENKNVKVAIVGGGPAGLSCSYELAKNGIKTVVFEKEKEIGGILNYGIPDFRLDKSTIKNIVKNLEKLGVEFRLNCELGKDISVKKLKAEYDFVFIGIGAEISSMYKLSDEKLENVYDSDEFLRAYNYKNYVKNLGKVIVIGGGNVAMDSARAAIHMGAKEVSILYRRDKSHMPAREIELEEALAEGVKFKELTRVISANSENGNIKSVHCIETEIIDGKAVDVEGKEFDYDANTVVFAIGLKPNKELILKEGLAVNEWGALEINEKNETSIENVYAGGDVSDNKSVVCKAIASGKKSANSILGKILK